MTPALLGCRRPCTSSAVSVPPPCPRPSSVIIRRRGKGRDGRREGWDAAPLRTPPAGRWYAPQGRAARGTMGRGGTTVAAGRGEKGRQEVLRGPAPFSSPTPRPARRGAVREAAAGPLTRARQRAAGSGGGGGGVRPRTRVLRAAGRGTGGRIRTRVLRVRPQRWVPAAAPRVAAPWGPTAARAPASTVPTSAPRAPCSSPHHCSSVPSHIPQYQPQPSHMPLTPSPPIPS